MTKTTNRKELTPQKMAFTILGPAMFRSIVEISILDYMSMRAVVCCSHAKVAHAEWRVFHIINSILRKVAYLHTRSAVNLVAVD